MFVKHEEREQGESSRELRTLDAVGQCLLRAAALIEKNGWIQGNSCDSHDRVCVLQAIGRSAGVDGVLRNDAIDRFGKGINSPCVFPWNDAPGRTKEEVVAKLRAVALGG